MTRVFRAISSGSEVPGSSELGGAWWFFCCCANMQINSYVFSFYIIITHSCFVCLQRGSCLFIYSTNIMGMLYMLDIIIPKIFVTHTKMRKFSIPTTYIEKIRPLKKFQVHCTFSPLFHTIRKTYQA